MLKQLIGATFFVLVVTTGLAQAGPIGWQQPFFTYSPGAQSFEAFEWTPMELAAFSAYGGYFANIRRPRFETPLLQVLVDEHHFGVEDEVKITANVGDLPTFLPQPDAFSMASFSSVAFDGDPDEAPVPEPGLLALVGTGMFVGSRLLRRRLRR